MHHGRGHPLRQVHASRPGHVVSWPEPSGATSAKHRAHGVGCPGVGRSGAGPDARSRRRLLRTARRLTGSTPRLMGTTVLPAPSQAIELCTTSGATDHHKLLRGLDLPTGGSTFAASRPRHRRAHGLLRTAPLARVRPSGAAWHQPPRAGRHLRRGLVSHRTWMVRTSKSAMAARIATSRSDSTTSDLRGHGLELFARGPAKSMDGHHKRCCQDAPPPRHRGRFVEHSRDLLARRRPLWIRD
jgi:hypothetical protein